MGGNGVREGEKEFGFGCLGEVIERVKGREENYSKGEG